MQLCLCRLCLLNNVLTQFGFDYCDAVWGNLNKGLANKIKKLQKKGSSYQSYDTRSDNLLQFLIWDDLALRRGKRLCLLTFDSKYITDLFLIKNPVTETPVNLALEKIF